jgi:uncharacterized protein YjiS (DUF1127 family)
MLRTVSCGRAIIGQQRASRARRLFSRHGGLACLGRAAIRGVLFWMERSRQRRALAELDDRLLRDIGLTREEALQERANPFWKP